MEGRGRLVAANAGIALVTLGAWLTMVFGLADSGSLAAVGLWSLKYYTILSNLLSAAASAWLVVCLVRGRVARSVLLVQYAATTSVMITFLVTLLFLGPTMGYAGLYRGANLFFHLLLPLAALAETCLLEPALDLSVPESLVAVVPTFVYACAYYGNILANGVGEGPAANDWYGFAAWGLERVPVVFAVMMVVTWLVALGVRALNEGRRG